MKNFGKLALLGAVIAASAHFASASTISGDTGAINIDGATDTGTVANSQFVLSSLGSFTLPQLGGDGTLGGYVLGDALYTFTAANGSIASTGSAKGSPAGELFSAYDIGGDSVKFIGQTYAFTPGADPNQAGQYEFVVDGYFTGSGFSGDVAGTDTIQFQGPPNSVSEDFAVAQAPEPNSLMLLGTGLLSGASMLIRKRRTA